MKLFKKKEKEVIRPCMYIAYEKIRKSIKSSNNYKTWNKSDRLIYLFLDLYKDSQYLWEDVKLIYNDLSAVHTEQGESLKGNL